MMPEDTARQIFDLRVQELAWGQVALWWLGQSGFVIHGGARTLIVDPFLSPGHDRAVPPAFSPDKGHGLDIIACTHEHIDHFDKPTVRALAAASPEAQIIVPRPIVDQAIELGIDRERIIGAQPDEPLKFGDDLTIHPVPACHGVNVSDAYSFGEQLSGGLVRFLGYVFDFGGAIVYHAGDTLAYDGQAERLRALHVDLMLLPINGRDHFREEQNLVGNMDPRDAAHLTADAGAETVIPMHWDMFPTNLGYPEHLVQYARERVPSIHALLPSRDRPLIYTVFHP